MGDRYGRSIWKMNMGDRYGRYGRSDINETSIRISIWNMGYRFGISIWNVVYRYGYLPYRYGHPGYRYGIWDNDMRDDRIDMVILDIDMGYLVTLPVGEPVVSI
jgi:hypothetical protein